MIQYLHNSKIDKQKWDKTLHACTYSLVYAESWYLDNISHKRWGAYITDDYNTVMPVFKRDILFFSHIINPFLCQQLGVYSTKTLSGIMIQAFCNMFSKFSNVCIALNYHNTQILGNTFEQNTYQRKNYILPVNDTTTSDAYSKQIQRNIKKAVSSKLSCVEEYSIEKTMAFFVAHKKKEIHLSSKNYSALYNVLTEAKKRQVLDIFKVVDKNGNTQSIAVFLSHKQRKTLTLLVTSEEGKKNGSSSYLIAQYIAQNTHSIIDFEGSSISGIERFYKGFGAINQPYLIFRKKIAL